MQQNDEIFPKRLTRFERARIIGLRALQLNLGAPPLIPLGEGEYWDSLEIATRELKSGSLPLTLRRTLPDGSYIDVSLIDLLRK